MHDFSKKIFVNDAVADKNYTYAKAIFSWKDIYYERFIIMII